MKVLRWFIGVLAFFAVLQFGSGIALTIRGFPYGEAGPMPFHDVNKVFLGVALIVTIVVAYVVDRSRGPSALEWVLYGLSILFVAIAFLVGDAVEASAPALALWTHRVTPWLAGLFAALGLYLRVRDLRSTEQARRERSQQSPGFPRGVPQ